MSLNITRVNERSPSDPSCLTAQELSEMPPMAGSRQKVAQLFHKSGGVAVNKMLSHLELGATQATGVSEEELDVRLAVTKAEIEEAQHLRYLVYCLDRGYEQVTGTMEADKHDEHSTHVLVRSGGIPVGTVRLIHLWSVDGPRQPPMAECLDEAGFDSRALFHGLPSRTTAELSRFSLLRQRDGMRKGSEGAARLALIRGILQATFSMGITHWCALMEPSLARLLSMSSIRFQQLAPGAEVEHKGRRLAMSASISDISHSISSERPALWKYLSSPLPVGPWLDTASE